MARAIDQFLATIRQAIYGRDVREAIASGIEQCYNDSTASVQKADIEAKGAEVLASIPDTYEDLQNTVGYKKRNISRGYVANNADGVSNVTYSSDGSEFSFTLSTAATNRGVYSNGAAIFYAGYKYRVIFDISSSVEGYHAFITRHPNSIISFETSGHFDYIYEPTANQGMALYSHRIPSGCTITVSNFAVYMVDGRIADDINDLKTATETLGESVSTLETDSLSLQNKTNAIVEYLPDDKFFTPYVGLGGTIDFLNGRRGTAADGTTTFDNTAILIRFINGGIVINSRSNDISHGVTSQSLTPDQIIEQLGESHYTVIDDKKYIILVSNTALVFDLSLNSLAIISQGTTMKNKIKLFEQRSGQIADGIFRANYLEAVLKKYTDNKVSQIDTSVKYYGVSDNILIRNADELAKIYAGCDYKRGNRLRRFINFLLIGDIHGTDNAGNISHDSNVNLDNAITYLNGVDVLDAGLFLGDAMAASAANGATWYQTAVRKAQKPFMMAIGNHDLGNSTDPALCLTNGQLVERYISPLNISATAPYYYVDFSEYTLRVIVLNDYDYADTLNGGAYVTLHGTKQFRQSQIDWLVDTLSNVPSDYGVIIAQHEGDPATPIAGNWNDTSYWQDSNDSSPIYPVTSNGSLGCMSDPIVEDIVNAWKNRTTLSKTYTTTGDGGNVVVDADFSSRINSEFICHVVGHKHMDLLARSNKYSDQIYIVHTASGQDHWVTQYTSEPRVKGTKSEDCLTVMSINRKYQTVNLTRIGAHWTHDMREKQVLSFSYKAET